MRLLWQSGLQTRRGTHYMVDNWHDQDGFFRFWSEDLESRL
jgi:hypothetical protein